MADERYDDIVARLQGISEELGDLSISTLRDAIESGQTSRPAEEKVLSQARRAVDKAITLLDGRSVTDD